MIVMDKLPYTFATETEMLTFINLFVDDNRLFIRDKENQPFKYIDCPMDIKGLTTNSKVIQRVRPIFGDISQNTMVVMLRNPVYESTGNMFLYKIKWSNDEVILLNLLGDSQHRRKYMNEVKEEVKRLNQVLFA